MTKPPKPPKVSKAKARTAAEDEETPIDPSEAALLREINEDLRRERLVAFWKRYGGWIVALVVVLALVAVGNRGWQYWQHARATEAVVAFEAAMGKLDARDVAGATEAFGAISKDYPGTVAALSALNQAVLLKKEGKTGEAVQVYVQLAGDRAADPIFRDLGRILAVSNGLDVLSAADVESLLTSIQNPVVWQSVADELAAYLALKQGDRQRAKWLLESAARNPNASQDMLIRVQTILLTLTDVPPGEGAADPAVGGEPADRAEGAGND